MSARETVETVEVVVVGYGPGAQALSSILGRRGGKVLAFERYPGLYNNARAGHIDHEVLRTVQAVSPTGAADLESTMHPALEEYVWLNGKGETILHQPHVEPGKRSVSGWYSDYTLWQPNLEDVFATVARETPVEVAFGWDVVGLVDHGDYVEVTANRVSYDASGSRELTEEYRIVRARYAVGGDGASSFVRRTLGIPRTDDGVDERWLVCDLRILDHTHTISPFMAQICDPARPRLVMPLGRTHRRFEWRVMPGETPEEMARPERAWKLLEEFEVTPDTHEIARQLVYRFQARTAQRWRAGNVFLIGDAAHTMPPYAGQGLCGAVRDGANLAWKLDLALSGVGGEGLLDSYEEERREHHRMWTELSIAEGRISNVLDPQTAEERDRKLLAEPMAVPDLPVIQSGCIDPSSPAAGQIAPQGRVRRGSRNDLLESAFPGPAFRLVLDGLPASDVLSDTALSFLARAGTDVLTVGGDAGFPEVDGTYRSWFDAQEAVAVLYRPDFYIYGTAASASAVEDLVLRLEDSITR
jgi:2-polyprenyl-6-methoxyphenol hydroxylase-like FAD-dependent oxidoreductase